MSVTCGGLATLKTNYLMHDDILWGVIIVLIIVSNYTDNIMMILIHGVLVLRTINPTIVYLSTATATTPTADGIIMFYWLIDAVIICANSLHIDITSLSINLTYCINH